MRKERVTTCEAIPLALMAMKETAASWVIVTVAPTVHRTPSREWKSRAVGSEAVAITSRLSSKVVSASGSMVTVICGTSTQ